MVSKQKRDFRGVTYHISVRNPKHVEKGVASMTVDGIAVDGNTIPLPTGKTEVLCRSGYGLILNHSNFVSGFKAGSSFTIFHYFPHSLSNRVHYAHPQTFDKVLRETSVSRSIFLCVYEIYSENRKFSLGLCHP